jgi:luciferase family oxidoreductase group 1
MPATSLRLSVLDLSPVPSGRTAAEALANTLDLARHAEALGYARNWLAEHHNAAGLASPSPEVMIGHVACATSRIRVGSGGVMLPNHAPLKVAETFRVLEALHPDRIDLGIGRAPGTDSLTALALRRSREALTADDFPEQLAELLAFFDDAFPQDHPFRRVHAIPEGVATPPIWILGSTDYGAHVAAALGLGFAFAHHINPEPAVDALRLYRERFRPTARGREPRAILAVAAIAGETDARADELARSFDLAWLRIRTGRRGAYPSVPEATAYPYTPEERQFVRANRERLLVGSPAALRERISRLAEAAGADEVMLLTMVHDHAARRRSYELLAEAFGLSGAPVVEAEMVAEQAPSR